MIPLFTEEVHAACSAAEPACPGNCLPSTARHLIHWNASADSIPERSPQPIPGPFASRSPGNSRTHRSPSSVCARLKTAFAKARHVRALLYGATKVQMQTWRRWRFLSDDRRRCQPHLRQPGGGTPTAEIPAFARRLTDSWSWMKKSFGGISEPPASLHSRHAPVNPEMSAALRDLQLHILGKIPAARRREAPTRESPAADPRSPPLYRASSGALAVLPGWLGSVLSSGFLNAVGEAQYGIGAQFNPSTARSGRG